MNRNEMCMECPCGVRPHISGICCRSGAASPEALLKHSGLGTSDL